MDLEDEVRQHRKELVAGALAVSKAAAFTLQLPCAVIAEGTVVTTNLAGLRGYLPCSTALASAPIERFLTLKAEHGFDRAFELCSSDDAEGEAFVEAWDECHRDLAEGVVCTLNDLVAMTTQAKNGWEMAPRRMLVVTRRGQVVTSGTVAVDWLLAG